MFRFTTLGLILLLFPLVSLADQKPVFYEHFARALQTPNLRLSGHWTRSQGRHGAFLQIVDPSKGERPSATMHGILLSPGRYQLRAKIKLATIKDRSQPSKKFYLQFTIRDPNIKKANNYIGGKRVFGTFDWKEVSFDFQVQQTSELSFHILFIGTPSGMFAIDNIAIVHANRSEIESKTAEKSEETSPINDICETCPQGDANVITGPWLQATTETSTVVMWESDRLVKGRVEFGIDKTYDTLAFSKAFESPPAMCDHDCKDNAAIIHEANITGLRPDTTYDYRIRMGNAVGPAYTFHTHADQGPYRVLHIADLHGFMQRKHKVKMRNALTFEADFVIMTSDLSQISINREYRNQIKGSIKSISNTPWYTVRGNHENRLWSTYTKWFYNEFPGHLDESFYSFDIGNVHFVAINEVTKRSLLPEQWIRSALRKTKKKWRVIIAKKPPFVHRRGYLFKIFEEEGVDVVISSYCLRGTKEKKIRGIWYITDCGGYNTIEMRPDAWTVASYKYDGTFVDTFSIQKKIKVSDKDES